MVVIFRFSQYLTITKFGEPFSNYYETYTNKVLINHVTKI